MDDNSRDRLILARRFLEPANSNHRQYEALRAFFVDRLPSAEVAARFGYTPGSFRVLVHQFRNQLKRDFFAATAREGRPPGKPGRLREQVVARWGKTGLVSLGFALTSARLFPTLKYALGHGRACTRVTVGGKGVVLPREQVGG